MQAIKTYRVALFDENIVSRRGMWGLIDDLPDFKVVVAGDGLDVATVLAAETDVVVYVPPRGSREVFRLLGKYQDTCAVPIVMFTTTFDRQGKADILALGVNGLVGQGFDMETLNRVLTCAVMHGFYYPGRLIDEVAARYYQKRNGHLVGAAFTRMHKDILHLLARGHTTLEIAEHLCKGQRTIEWHKEKMMAMVGVKTTIQLVLFAQEHGLIDSYYREKPELIPSPAAADNSLAADEPL